MAMEIDLGQKITEIFIGFQQVVHKRLKILLVMLCSRFEIPAIRENLLNWRTVELSN